MSSNHSEVAET